MANRTKTLWNVWRENAEKYPEREAIVHWRFGEEPVRWRWGDLISRAQSFGRLLLDKGVRQGEVCSLIIRHNPEFYPLYMGIEAIGAIPTALAYPNQRLHPEKFRAGLRGMTSQSGLDWILTEDDLEPQVGPLVLEPGSTVKGILKPLAGLSDLPVSALPDVAVSPEEICLLQHSSGTTGLQKAVALSHRAVGTHLDNYAASIELRETDRIVSWLPLYHDMGLISAYQLALRFAVPLVQIDPFEWVMIPSLLWNVVSAEQGTLIWMPNFAYNLLADRTRDEDLDGLRLDSLRMILNGGEPVRYESHRRFLNRFEAYGIRPEMLAADYGMAETTCVVTQTLPGREPPVLAADRNALSAGRFIPAEPPAPVRYCVSSGAPIRGCTLRVTDEQGNILPDDQVGELLVTSGALFDGYRNRPDLTAQVLIDGWYKTGDYAFFHDGECYVIGRKKDTIIVAGKNLYPEDIEDAVGMVPGVAPGRVVAFGYDDLEMGTERVAVVAETEIKDAAGLDRLALDIVAAVMALDVTVSRIILTDKHWLIKSSAGKPSRSANRQRLGEDCANQAGVLLMHTFGDTEGSR